jgi:hypothetical protein
VEAELCRSVTNGNNRLSWKQLLVCTWVGPKRFLSGDLNGDQIKFWEETTICQPPPLTDGEAFKCPL